MFIFDNETCSEIKENSIYTSIDMASLSDVHEVWRILKT